MNTTATTGRQLERAMAVLTALALLIGMAMVLAPSADAAAGTNDAEYWETQFEHPAKCYKHEIGESTPHGAITDDGYTVTLNPFDQNWWGDHWEALIVKAGSGEGSNLVTHHPSAGVAYPAPDGKEVSHWIVCKGETPVTTTTEEETTTSTTEQQTTTSTTEQQTTTSTTEQQTTTSTTEQQTTTSTTEQETTTTTERETSTTERETTTTTQPSTTTTEAEIAGTVVTTTPEVEVTSETLPFTGFENGTTGMLALALVGSGLMVLTVARAVAKENEE